MQRATLVDSAGAMASLDLIPENGYVVQRFDSPTPEVRTVLSARHMQSGSRDASRLYGASVVTMNVALAPELSATPTTDAMLARRLRAWVQPSLRPWLYYQASDIDHPVRYLCRGEKANATFDDTDDDFTIATIQWVVPDGTGEGDEQVTTIYASASSPPIGRTYNRTFPHGFGGPAPISSVLVNSDGSAASHFVARLYGPCTFPTLTSITTNETLRLDLSLASGDFVLLDTRSHLVLLNGNTADPAYDTLMFPESRWWLIPSGDSQLRYLPDTFLPGAKAELIWRPAYL